uniref:Uncharacterized protein n=1 Tax=Panagrolaimus sp. PS1159 TaxID=55785 RepID=A0AC35GW81_9BILA
MVANRFNANLAELYLIDGNHTLITVENDKFDAELTPDQSYNVYDNREQPSVELNIIAPLARNHSFNFEKSLQILAPVGNIYSNIKLQGLALVTMNAKDFSLEPGDYKHIKNLKSLRSAVHDLTSAVTKTYLETNNYAGEIHAGISNILKGVPDMLKEIDSPNANSKEVIEDLETWMDETLQECYDQSKNGTVATEALLEHIHELESALIASIGAQETKSNNKEENEERLQLLKKQQKRFEQAKMDAKLEIDKAWKTKTIDKNAHDEYDIANENGIKKMRQISELEFVIKQATKKDAKNEDILKVLRESIAEIQDVKENWRNASSVIYEMKNKLKVEKDGGRWKNATESSKIDLNKRHLIENMLKFLEVGYKVDYWTNVQNQITKDYLLPLASSATNVFSGGKTMDKSKFQYNKKEMEINVNTVTPKQLGIVFRISNIQQKMLQDEEGVLHEIQDNKFDPKLKPQRKYVLIDLDNLSEQQQKATDKPENFHDTSTTGFSDFNGQKPDKEDSNQKLPEKVPPEHSPKLFAKNQAYPTEAIVLRDNKAYLKSGKIFFENIANGCVAIEELVLLSASAPDVKLADCSSLRVCIYNGIRALGQSYTEAGNTLNEIKLRFNEIPTSVRQGLEAFSQHENTHQHLQTFQYLVNNSIETAEKKINLFKSPQSEFFDLEHKVKTSEKKDEFKKKSEREKLLNGQTELKHTENAILQKNNEIKNLNFLVQNLSEEIEAFERDAAKQSDKAGKGWFSGNKNNDQTNDLQRQNFQQQQISARKQKHQLENEIDNLEEKKILLKHQTTNAKIESSTNWEIINASLNKVIFQIGEIEKTWILLLNFIKTIETSVKEMQNVVSSGNSDNSIVRNAALQVWLNSWVICQCCEIYNDIVKSHIVPLISSVTSNFGLSLKDAKNHLSNEKTKAQQIKNEVASLADRRLLEAANNLDVVSTETEKVFAFFFSTAV